MAVGAARLVSTPSRRRAWLGIAILQVPPTLSSSTPLVSRWALNLTSSPVRLPFRHTRTVPVYKALAVVRQCREPPLTWWRGGWQQKLWLAVNSSPRQTPPMVADPGPCPPLFPHRRHLGGRRDRAGAALLHVGHAKPGARASPRPGGRRFACSTRSGHLVARFGDVAGHVVLPGELPPYVPGAFIAIEDRRFYDHGAFDLQGIVRASLSDLATAASCKAARPSRSRSPKHCS